MQISLGKTLPEPGRISCRIMPPRGRPPLPISRLDRRYPYTFARGGEAGVRMRDPAYRRVRNL